MRAFYRFALRRFPVWFLLTCCFPVCRAGEIPTPQTIDLATPPGRMVDIGGYRLHIYCQGRGSPAVIFDAGLGGFSMDWLFVQSLLRDDTQVCAYDRAGYGWSDPGPPPRVSDQIAEELAILLNEAGIAPPYVLVGHSFGAYNVEFFAKIFPKAVAGIILVDASHPKQADRLPDLPARAGIPNPHRLVTFFNPNVVYAHYPERLWFPISALMSSSKALTTQQRELSNFTVSAAQVEHAGALPQVPLIVITRGRRVWPEGPMGDAQEKAWAELQRELTESVAGGRQIIAQRSGHLIQLDEPEVVAAAVRDILKQSCGAHMAQATAPNYMLTC